MKLLLIAIAGALGTLARLGLSGVVQRWSGGYFPAGVLAVNLTGCFVFGIVLGLGGERLALSQETRAILLIGFLGGFTTYSTYAADCGVFLRDGQYGLLALNIALHNVLGVAAFLGGLAVARWF